ncbi:rhamnulokinase [Saccharibacillus kuerlensis]|uniref:Rhamnulokinase n=1 Tax=Saccharibacillus kuerlensis TaxID=459527 RepID=A0ABQ2L3R6_9BACL|nr:rhamnulokinase [Saccharibacillus kuerlensis]GGO01551.1 rhamnulokinase [Saccharibacillus kuerlensis]
MTYAISVDIGASSGRLVVASLVENKLVINEIHRFGNAFLRKNRHDYWDMDALLAEIMTGLKKAKAAGIDQCTLGIDTWGVDYVLLDQNGKRLHDVYAYRDGRTTGASELFHQKELDREVVYEKTGIQELRFNTLYQLYVHEQSQLDQAAHILLVPDYLYYCLTGRLINETTNASTTQLLNLQTRSFDEELLQTLGLRRNQFAELTSPGTILGGLKSEFADTGEYPMCQVVVAPTHDTASAVVGVPACRDRTWAYISSGTWSLLGTERKEPLNGEAPMKANYTNEWGAYDTFRFLKNIMGLWMIQEVRREDGARYSFAQLAEQAEREPAFRSLVPCNDERFLNPDSMTDTIRAFCLDSGQPLPDTPARLARCIFDSLALTYFCAMEELEQLTGIRYEVLHIVGGGANNRLLSQLTADLLGIEVHTGPSEATAIGNIAVQLIASRELADLKAARQLISDSFPPAVHYPQPLPGREELINRWHHINQMTVKETLQ